MQPSSFADLTRAAQRQQPGAINALAQALVRAGQPEEALVWYLRSAAAGDALAQVEAGRMRAYGVGCEVDVGQARAHWELAERQGAAAARYLLATLAVGEQPLTLAGTAQDRLQS
ncbi:2OG-Fe(II) oxygenase, partial [Xanthomonas perforans]